MQLLLGFTGTSLCLYGLTRKDRTGLLLSGVGFAAVLAALKPLQTARILRHFFHPEITLKRTLDVEAPLEVVFDFWKDFNNYSRFLSYVDGVKLNDKQGFTWTIIGPAGIPIHWDAAISRLIPNQMITWKSLPGALVMNSGLIYFRSHPNQKQTRIEIFLSYAPPAGALGYEAIRILGFDPRTRIDADLLTMKKLIEHQSEIEGSLRARSPRFTA